MEVQPVKRRIERFEYVVNERLSNSRFTPHVVQVTVKRKPTKGN